MAQPLLSVRALGERAAAAVLAAVGVAALYKASALPFGNVSEPGSGFFPILIGAALMLFGGVSFFLPSAKPAEGQPAAPRGEWLVWMVIAALVAYALALSRVGFVPCTALIVLLLLRGVGAVPWRASLAIAVVAAVACYLLFTRLGVPLPAGLLAFR